MDLKSFIVGAVCGGLVYAGVSFVLTREPPSMSADGDRGVAERKPRPPSEVLVAVDENPGSPSSDSEATSTSGRSASSSASAQLEPAPQAVRDTENSPRSVGSVQPDHSAATAQDRSFFTTHRARLLKEPKDQAWSYFMEQAILQFLTRHSAMPQFSLEYIECRTSSCQIAVAGHDESTAPTWQRVMYDMRQEPWYEFVETGTSSGPFAGRHMILADLRRQPSD
jgi:hypothetical protein